MGFRSGQQPAPAPPGSGRGREGHSEGPRAHARFEGGNLGASEWPSPAHFRFNARADASPRPLWFYFCLENVRVPSVVCELVNADECFGPRRAWNFARPVYSVDGRNWRRVERADYHAPGDGPGTFRFSVPIHSPVTYVAYCIPYTNADLQALLDSLSGSRVSVQTCGRTAEGRTLSHLTFGTARPGAPAIWVLARQHAGEAPASWVADGLIRALAAADLRGVGGAIHVVPMVDPDGVSAGRYGKDEQPIDFNRDWCSSPSRAETAAILGVMRRIHAAHPLALVLDIHASHHGDTECYLFGETQGRAAARELQELFVERLAQHSPAGIGLRRTDLRISPPPPHSARGYLALEFGCPALTLEVSYHLTQSGRYPGVQDYSELGVATAGALLALFDGGNHLQRR